MVSRILPDNAWRLCAAHWRALSSPPAASLNVEEHLNETRSSPRRNRETAYSFGLARVSNRIVWMLRSLQSASMGLKTPHQNPDTRAAKKALLIKDIWGHIWSRAGPQTMRNHFEIHSFLKQFLSYLLVARPSPQIQITKTAKQSKLKQHTIQQHKTLHCEKLQ